MPDLPISGLPSGSLATADQTLPIVQGGVTNQITTTDLGQGIFNLDLPLSSSGITLSGDIVPRTPRGSNLGSPTQPFREIYVQSGSINIESDVPGDLNTTISNIEGNLLISAGGIQLLGDGAFNATTGSFRYLSGSLEYIGQISVEGDIKFDGNSALLTASLSSSTLTFTKTDDSTFNINLPIYNNSSGSNIDNLGGTAVRTLYSRNGVVSFTPGTNVDFMSGSINSIWGVKNIPQSFLQNTDFTAKVIHFRTFGAFGSAGGNDNIRCFIQIGNDKLISSDIGNVTLTQPDNHPFEIVGELIFTGGQCTVCYSLRHCDNQGDFKAYPLGDAANSDIVTSFTGGDFKLIVSGSSINPMTSYASYIQIFN